ncbi:uncharacterized protein A4U43_C08F18860 [Asparagus officinalis]|nr:uncharacterized protein A4U43_C08F18860 [Asparagus officinalis]
MGSRDQQVESSGGFFSAIKSWGSAMQKSRSLEEDVAAHTTGDFRKVVANFSASWCGPCRQITPLYTELSEKYPQLVFLTIDVDELADTLKSPPAENKVMKKASFIGVSTTTTFYFLCGYLGYAAFGNKAPGYILTGFGFYEPFWLIYLANICIIIHLVGAFKIAFGPVFKCNSTVWRALMMVNLAKEKNQWMVEIDKFTVEVPRVAAI